MKNFYITTPIYYVNDKPHIGHAYTTLACDILARFKRTNGYNVKFLTGTDEHGQKVEKSAFAKNIDPQEFTDIVSQRFRDLTKLMNFSNDDFIRTTEERHKKGAQFFWQKLIENNHIYLDKYEGWYSVRDEAFYQESELIDGKAPTGAEVEWVKEPSYFFNLSKWEDKLLEFYEENPDFIKPQSRRNEVISFVKSGLKDLSVSRTSFKWGVKVPNDEDHIMYVWLDALTNYLTAIGYPDETKEYKEFWPADFHIVGKDILRFHAIYWPAFLMAANLPLPKQIIAHGWWTNEGQKISKSLGNVIDPNDLVAEYGLDQTRYFLMREVPFGNDGNFSKENMVHRINSDLSNNLGNLIQRTLSQIFKNCNNEATPILEAEDNEMLEKIFNYKVINDHIDKCEFHLALEKIFSFSAIANEYIDKQAPWTLKDNPERMRQILYSLAEAIKAIIIYLQPFMPNICKEILDFMKIENRNFDSVEQRIEILSIDKPKGFFPRYEVKNDS